MTSVPQNLSTDTRKYVNSQFLKWQTNNAGRSELGANEIDGIDENSILQDIRDAL